MCRRPFAKLNPISGFTSICDTPGSRYSTGSSMVMMRPLHRVDAGQKSCTSVVDFTRAGRPRHHHDAVGLGQQRLDEFGLFLVEVQPLEPEAIPGPGR